jgi:16S rRNA (cytosine967-C5)-methyltransferase
MLINAARFEALVSAFRSIAPLQQPADVGLRFFFQNNPKLGAQDRAFIAETIFSILRRRRYLEHIVGEPTVRHLVLAALIKFHGLSVAVLNPFISETEKKWLEGLKANAAEDLPLAVKADFPDWLIEKLSAFLSPEEILKMANGFQNTGPLDLRVNTMLAKHDEVLEILNQENRNATATPYSSLGIRLEDKFTLNKHPLFLEGKVEVQDEGSQLLGFLVGPKRGEMIVDFCAGAGGKTLLLGALMHNQGRLYAFDISEKRLNNLRPRLKRSGLSNVHPQLIAHERDTKIKRLAGKIDRVLVDAPCSGLGTLRRNPDLKWRQSPQGIEELKIKQTAILNSAANLLKFGGRLVYATCSILPEENQNIVEAFLKSHNDFELLNASEILSQQKISLDTGKYLQLLPHLHGTDGFFAAVFHKKIK